MRAVVFLIICTIAMLAVHASTAWVDSHRPRQAPEAIIPSDYQRCVTVRPGPPGRRGKITLYPNNSEIV